MPATHILLGLDLLEQRSYASTISVELDLRPRIRPRVTCVLSLDADKAGIASRNALPLAFTRMVCPSRCDDKKCTVAPQTYLR
jgi:hypothetical protein